MNALRRLRQQPKLAIVAAGLSMTILLGLLDYLTGPEVSLSVLYLLPITAVTWLTDRRIGILVATVGAATWLMADLTSGATYSNPLIPYWNAGVRFAFFLIVVYLESALKTSNQELEARVEERTARLAAEIAERQKADQRLQQYAERLEILHEIDRAILHAHSLEANAQAVAHHLLKLLPCQRVSVTLFDFQSQQIVIFAAAADEEAGVPPSGSRLPLDTFDNVAEMLELLRRGEAQLVPDLRDLALGSPSTRDVLSKGFRSSISVPIVAQEELLGILNLLTREPGVFTSEHVEMAREVANQMGIAIQQARLWDQLQNSREDLQSLSQKLLNVQEAERRHLARELHDEIGQALTGLSLALEMIAHLPAEAAASELGEAQELVVDLMERVSNLSLELRPALLDDLGLLPTLLWHLERFSSQTHVKVVFKHSGVEGQRFTPECETTVYRIIQEALTNVARHASVLEARVTLWVDQGVLGLQIEDRGTGFDPEAILAAGNSSGLASMRERARLQGGELTIESAPASGTRVMAEIPIVQTRRTQEGSPE